MLTASTETGEKATYTVTIPMQPDIDNRKLSWKEDLTDAIYYTKDSEGNVLAVETGVMSGRANGQLDPKGAATRAEVAQMFKNYIEKVVL